MSKKINFSNKEMLYDAASMMKTVFIEYYAAQDYNQDDLGEAWHNFRSMPECKRLVGKQMRYQAPPEKGGYKPDVVTNEEVAQKEEVQKALSQRQQVSTPAISSSNPKLEQVKELYEAGTTKPSAIAEKMGISAAYANKLLKKIK